jgi:sugar-phosphatase
LSEAFQVLKCAAVLFDLDGVLVDSSAVIEASWRKWALSRGIDEATLMPLVHGRPAVDVLRLAAPHLSVELEMAELVRQEVENEDGTEPYRGAAALVGSLPARRWAVVTSAPRAIAPGRLRRLDCGQPAALVCADDVDAGKPSPEGYLRAARDLGVAADDCVVVEDSLPGVEAGLAAGMRVIAVATTSPAAELRSAHCIAVDISRIAARVTADGVICLTVQPAEVGALAPGP